MKHQSGFTQVFLEGKLHWVSRDGMWIRPVVRGGDGEEDEDADNNGEGDKPTITQKQLNEILKTRVGKAREKAVEDLLKDFGVDSPEAVKAIIKSAKEAEEKNQTELEKAQKSSAENEGKATAAKDELAQFKLQTAKEYALIGEGLNVDQARITAKLVDCDEDDAEKIKAAVEALKTTMPQLFEVKQEDPNKPTPIGGKNPGTPPPGGSGNGNNDPAAKAKRLLYERHPELNKQS